MSYVDSTLMKNEVVLYKSRPHWIVFGPAIFWFAITMLFFIYGPHLGPARTNIGSIYRVAGFITFLVAIVFAISAFINYQTSEYAVTNKRVLMKMGLVRRITLEIFHHKIEAVRIYQSILGRLLGYGSIVIIGVGGSKDPFTNIPNPLEFRKKVQEQIETVAEAERSTRRIDDSK